MRVKAKKILIFDKIAILNLFIALMLLYFTFHSIYGQRGIISYFKMQAELKKSYQQLELLRAERLEINNRSRLLQPGSLDIDMLDEQIRNVLGASNPKEQIFKSS